jgi:hypothetical protein
MTAFVWAPQLARELDIPYVLMLGYDLAAEMLVASDGGRIGLRPSVRAYGRYAWRYCTREISNMRPAASIHCNGYPIFDAAQRHTRGH